MTGLKIGNTWAFTFLRNCKWRIWWVWVQKWTSKFNIF